MITMPKGLKEKWLAALRSGEYQQCVNTLHNGEGYCCLGVLQMVADGEVEDSSLPSSAWIKSHNVRSASYDIESATGFWCVQSVHGEDLPYINDTGATFAEIADIIEDQVVVTEMEA